MFKRSGSPKLPAQEQQLGKASAPVEQPSNGAASSSGKLAYEARRAAKAGVSLERWMTDKQKRAQAELEASRRARVRDAPRKPGFLKRLLDRAHKPL